MPTFQNTKFRGSGDAGNFGVRYRQLIRKRPFLAFGLPFILVVVAGSFVLTPATAIRYEKYDRKVRQMTKDEELNVRRAARKVDMKDEYYVSSWWLVGQDTDGSATSQETSSPSVMAKCKNILLTERGRSSWAKTWRTGSREGSSDCQARMMGGCRTGINRSNQIIRVYGSYRDCASRFVGIMRDVATCVCERGREGAPHPTSSKHSTRPSWSAKRMPVACFMGGGFDWKTKRSFCHSAHPGPFYPSLLDGLMVWFLLYHSCITRGTAASGVLPDRVFGYDERARMADVCLTAARVSGPTRKGKAAERRGKRNFPRDF